MTVAFFEILTKPQPVLEKEKKNADTMKALKTFALLGVLWGLVISIAQIALGSLSFLGGMPWMGALFAGLGIISIIVLPILFAVFGVIFSILAIGIVWIVAKILGGKGTFEENYYLYSRVVIPVFVVSMVLTILGMIPVIGFIFGLIGFLFNIYVFYVFVLMVSVAHKVSKLKAFIITILPFLVLMAVLIVLVGAAVIAALTGAAVI